jgi:putative spermidine/putrescine transport system ATP-binding protein
MARIHIDGVTKRFGAVTAVDRMHLDLQEGELVAFLGPSGCGKTTTLRMVAGFEQATSGVIRFGDRDVTHDPPERRNVGMVFQNYALFPHMTVAQNVAYGLDMRRVPRSEVAQRVAAMLDKVQLTGLGGRYVRQISGGQQQRTALARALVINPSVLLLDEPLANLDAKLREEMRFYIRSLQREFAITTIYVTHDQSEALVLADRIAVMMHGRLQQLASPRDVYERPANAIVADFVGLTNFIDGRVERNHAGDLTIATPYGPLPAHGAIDIAVGARVRICVRPEAFTLTPAGDGAAGIHADQAVTTATGRVGDVAYLGSLYDFPIHVAEGLTLRVQTADPSCAQPGLLAHVRFHAARTWAVPHTAEA